MADDKNKTAVTLPVAMQSEEISLVSELDSATRSWNLSHATLGPLPYTYTKYH